MEHKVHYNVHESPPLMNPVHTILYSLISNYSSHLQTRTSLQFTDHCIKESIRSNMSHWAAAHHFSWRMRERTFMQLFCTDSKVLETKATPSHSWSSLQISRLAEHPSRGNTCAHKQQQA